MMSAIFNPLSSLDVSNCAALSIKARVTRMWHAVKEKPTLGFDARYLILVDSEDYPVVAAVYGKDWNRFDGIMHEGCVYEISRFLVRRKVDLKLRPVRSDLLLVLGSETIVIPVAEDDKKTIPLHSFSLVDFNNVKTFISAHNNAEIPETTFDVIGAVHYVDRLGCQVVDGCSYYRTKFVITDGRDSLQVVAKGDIAPKIHQAFESKEKNDILIIILTSCKLSVYSDVAFVTNLSHSRVYFNLDFHSVEEMRQRLIYRKYNADAGYPLIGSTYLHMPDLFPYTLKFVVHCFLEATTKNLWTNYSCNISDLFVYRVDNNMNYIGSSVMIPSPEKRFKLVLKELDDSGATEVVLHDLQSSRIISTNPISLIDEINKVPLCSNVFDNVQIAIGDDFTIHFDVKLEDFDIEQYALDNALPRFGSTMEKSTYVIETDSDDDSVLPTTLKSDDGGALPTTSKSDFIDDHGYPYNKRHIV